MKLFYNFCSLCIALLFFGQIGYSQIENNYLGEYTVVAGSPADIVKIYKDKVEAYREGVIVEKLFFVAKEEETYLLEKTKLDVESIDLTTPRDRRIIKTSIKNEENNTLTLSFILNSGAKTEITLQKQ